jgi:hypothetical protein
MSRTVKENVERSAVGLTGISAWSMQEEEEEELNKNWYLPIETLEATIDERATVMLTFTNLLIAVETLSNFWHF